MITLGIVVTRYRSESRVKPPVVKSWSVDTAFGCRSRLFGVKTISGLRMPRRSRPPYIWRRSRWKYCAGVVQLHTCMLFSAQSVRKRSMRALECSGPLPFVAVRQQHHQPARLSPLLLRQQEMNWSIMICAPLAKSPNCASQITSVSGSATL